jgi:ppGpp synthetase/RelA/SpoT-type nucleotidyltranferase
MHTAQGQYAKGGKIGFDALSDKVARRYKGKKVDKEYQDEYGKTYDAQEAKEVGDKVAGKVYRQQLAKKRMMAKGGEVEDENQYDFSIRTYKDNLDILNDNPDYEDFRGTKEDVLKKVNYSLKKEEILYAYVWIENIVTDWDYESGDLERMRMELNRYGENEYAKGGMVVTKIKDIPNFQQRLDEGRITYRGLGMGKKANDFYKLAGTWGTSIKVDGKEYNITDEEFATFSRGSDGKMRIRFSAPARRGYAKGGQIASIGDSGIITDKNSMFVGKMALVTGDLGNMYEVNVGGKTTILKKSGLDIIHEEEDYYAKGGEVANYKVGDLVLLKYDIRYGREDSIPHKIVDIDDKMLIIEDASKFRSKRKVPRARVDPSTIIPFENYAKEKLSIIKSYAKGGEVDKEFPIGYIMVVQERFEDYKKAEKILKKHGIQIDASKDFHTKGFADELYGEFNNGVETYVLKFDINDAPNPQSLVKDIHAFEKKNPEVAVQFGKYYAKGGEIVSEIESKYALAGKDSGGVWAYSKMTADEIAKEYNGSVQEDGSKWYVSLKNFAKGGEVEQLQVGDIVTHKKGRQYGHGKIYKISDIGIFIEDKYGNKREKPFYFPNEFKKVSKMFGEGGKADVYIENKDVKFDKKRYKGILSDFDLDGLPNVDDPDPFGNQDKSSIEQVKFSNTFNKVLDTKKNLDSELKKFVSKLQKSTSSTEKIYARAKTPFSILNKLVDSRLLDEKRGLKDLVGTTITFENLKDLENYKRKVRRGDMGKVLDYDDYYTNPNDGYRAYHFIIDQDGVPIELQLKTDRMKEVNILSHDAYKNKNLNKDYMLYLTNLADKADNGDELSKEKFLVEMSDKGKVRKMLSAKN